MSALEDQLTELQAAADEADKEWVNRERTRQRELYEGSSLPEAEALHTHTRNCEHKVPGFEAGQIRNLEVALAQAILRDPDAGIEATHSKTTFRIVNRSAKRLCAEALDHKHQTAQALSDFLRKNGQELLALEAERKRKATLDALTSGSPEAIKLALGLGNKALRTSDLNAG